MLDKTKQTLLSEEWSNLADITTRLYNDLGLDESKPEVAAESKKSDTMLSLHQTTSPKQIAASKGFEIGAHIYEKAFGSQTIYKIEFIAEIGADKTVKLKAYDAIDGYGDEQAVELDDLFAKFNVFKGELRKLVDPKVIEKKSIIDADCMLIDNCKASLFSAMQTYHKKHGLANPSAILKLVTHPSAAIACKQLKQDKLCVVPVVPLANITTSHGLVETRETCLAGKKKCKLSLTSPKAYNSETDVGYLHLFFWLLNCKKTDVKSEANIFIKHVQHGVVWIPVWSNSKTIEAGDELVYFQAKRKADSVVVPEDDEPKDGSKKKDKKSNK